MADETRNLVDAGPVAEALGVTRGTVLEMAREGRIPRVKLSRRFVRFDLGQVLQAVQGREPANQ